MFWRERNRQQQREVGMHVVNELEFRVARLGVNCYGEVRFARHPWDAILTELRRGDYQLTVMGGYNRSTSGRPYLGATIRTVLARSAAPTVLLLTQQESAAVGAAA
jgi:nucleotide-binding universal stress UspA family protein